jgi:hypothetical protein
MSLYNFKSSIALSIASMVVEICVVEVGGYEGVWGSAGHEGTSQSPQYAALCNARPGCRAVIFEISWFEAG